ncbi:hypothetical protein H072_5713 [Dactylellina haptotyla CBS 200.50]|uniref:Uncharacterized protein n=1 Tax=Dactylellina haptotyla (strain CBS 200.50) TaxID=1284197 RepID=S8BLX1_DACHA|nr:hypothetical protein H072_5713 [Dactylellina haptotyla CBS 200.50]
MNYNPVHHIVRSPKLASNLRRNNFLTERGKLNSLRDHNERNQRPSLKGALINVETEQLPFPDQFKGQNRYTAGGRGVRLSRTPPPFIVEPDELGEPILPPTPERPRDRSPRTKRRDFEAIFSSGSRKRRKSTELDLQNISPIRSLAARENGGVAGIAKSNYYASSSRRKNKANTLQEHRDALQREIKKLEEELVVEKRRILTGKHLQAMPLNRARFENEFPISLARWLSVNDQMVASKTEIPTIPQNGAVPRSVLPLKNSHSSQNTKNLCPLTFTNYGPELSASLVPYSINQHRRIVQGYSHESLLHFQLSMDILGMSIPQIQAVSVDCSDWARLELGPSLYLFSSECNINKTLYAISSFSNMARHRASVWASLHRDFSDWTDISDKSLATDNNISAKRCFNLSTYL